MAKYTKNGSWRSIYVVGVIVAMLLGVVASVIITVTRPETDNLPTIVLIFGFLAPTTVSLLTYLKAEETHKSVNSRLDSFVESETRLATSLGIEEGRERHESESRTRTKDHKNS